MLLVAAAPSGGQGKNGPATLYSGGVVFTTRAPEPDATWFVVRDGRFVDVGGGPVPARWSEAPRRVDLGGQFVMPGFVDAHVHFIEGGLALLQTNLGRAQTRPALEAALRGACAAPQGDWVLVRNLDVAALGGLAPSLQTLGDICNGGRPVLALLRGGRRAYLNRAGWLKLGLTDSSGGGLLAGDEVRTAIRRIQATLPRQLVARAILTAQRRALSFGITAIGDDTYYPAHAVQYERLADSGHFHMRASLRSEGPAPDSRFLMRNVGLSYLGFEGDQIRYLGEGHVVDGELGSIARDGSIAHGEPAGAPRLATAELERIFLYAKPYGATFRVQGQSGLERILSARRAVGPRRDAEMLDVLDQCGSCGGQAAKRIFIAGFQVTIVPSQLHELPELVQAYGAATTKTLLPFRDLFRAGLEPALTSDWPRSSASRYSWMNGRADGCDRLELSPLASVAVAVSGRRPDGQRIPDAAERTIGLPHALRGVTTNGAAAVGRSADLGRISRGYLADFVVLERSPFDLEEGAGSELYDAEVRETWVGGVRRYLAWTVGEKPEANEARTAQIAKSFGGRPAGWAASPILGYDPTTGIILGGAFFFYPYETSGFEGKVMAMVLPQQSGRVAGVVETNYRGLAPGLDLKSMWGFVNWQGNYYGVGMDAPPDAELETSPTEVEGGIGVELGLAPALKLGVYGLYGYKSEDESGRIEALAGQWEGHIDGHRSALKVSLIHDTRSSQFSTRSGGYRELWAEAWLVQGSTLAPRGRVGATVSQFVPLYAPDLILALHGEAGTSFGERAFDTNYKLGGIAALRGYRSHRFRGHHYVYGAAELRYPIWAFISGVVYGETGMMWVDDRPDDASDLGYVGGLGLRFGLPPDYLIKLRFDLGFTPDQWGVFFAFNEAF